MRTPLAWLNLVHEKTRLQATGVAFAVILVFMNLGFGIAGKISQLDL